jgi:hypothetical protein
MSWIYKNQVFTPEMIPEGAVGFVYEMTAIIDGKSCAYIGKKNFHSVTKKKLTKKNTPTDRRKKNYERVAKLAYENYFSSNATLKEAHKDKIPIKRNILQICYSKTELTYMETKYQFVKGVLESDLYLNGNILGRFYKLKK